MTGATFSLKLYNLALFDFLMGINDIYAYHYNVASTVMVINVKWPRQQIKLLKARKSTRIKSISVPYCVYFVYLPFVPPWVNCGLWINCAFEKGVGQMVCSKGINSSPVLNLSGSRKSGEGRIVGCNIFNMHRIKN